MARAKQTIADEITAAGGTPPTDLNEVTAQDLEAQLASLPANNVDAQALVDLQFSEADDDGNRWKTVQEGKQVRVYLLDRNGRGFDTLVKDEGTGKAFLKDYAARQ